jgi:hypothetical protein
MTNPSSITEGDLPELLNQLQRQQFFGTLEIKVERGVVVLIRQTQTIKPSNAARSYRDIRAYDSNQTSR